MQEKRDREKNETVGEKRRRLRLKRGVGMVNGEEASWITKSIIEMTQEELKEYNRKNQEWARKTMDEPKIRLKDKEHKHKKKMEEKESVNSDGMG